MKSSQEFEAFLDRVYGTLIEPSLERVLEGDVRKEMESLSKELSKMKTVPTPLSRTKRIQNLKIAMEVDADIKMVKVGGEIERQDGGVEDMISWEYEWKVVYESLEFKLLKELQELTRELLQYGMNVINELSPVALCVDPFKALPLLTLPPAFYTDRQKSVEEGANIQQAFFALMQQCQRSVEECVFVVGSSHSSTPSEFAEAAGKAYMSAAKQLVDISYARLSDNILEPIHDLLDGYSWKVLEAYKVVLERWWKMKNAARRDDFDFVSTNSDLPESDTRSSDPDGPLSSEEFTDILVDELSDKYSGIAESLSPEHGEFVPRLEHYTQDDYIVDVTVTKYIQKVITTNDESSTGNLEDNFSAHQRLGAAHNLIEGWAHVLTRNVFIADQGKPDGVKEFIHSTCPRAEPGDELDKDNKEMYTHQWVRDNLAPLTQSYFDEVKFDILPRYFTSLSTKDHPGRLSQLHEDLQGALTQRRDLLHSHFGYLSGAFGMCLGAQCLEDVADVLSSSSDAPVHPSSDATSPMELQEALQSNQLRSIQSDIDSLTNKWLGDINALQSELIEAYQEYKSAALDDFAQYARDHESRTFTASMLLHRVESLSRCGQDILTIMRVMGMHVPGYHRWLLKPWDRWTPVYVEKQRK
eukprot:Nk52_evm3s2656 gene=Nk52_evmTU3s2656